MKRSRYLLLPAVLLLSIAPVWAQSFQYPVKHRHIRKDCRGVLIITPERVEYRTDNKNDSRKWKYEEIRTIEIKSPTEISLVTYEDQKRWLGKDRIFDFILVEKKAAPELSSFLLAHVKRPMKLAVLPEETGKPTYELPVKHLGTISGTQGVLLVYPDKVVYKTTAAGDSRYWRISDIERFSQPDRYRFEIVSYVPKTGGPNEVYNFQLFEDLPEGVFDFLWVRLHPSSYYPESK
jgi:hypothetical protein